MNSTALNAPQGQSRRSPRVSIAIPVSISGQDSSGSPFIDAARTIDVNRHGARIATSNPWAPGSEIEIENLALRRSAPGRVVWCGERPSLKYPFEVSVDFGEPQGVRGLWGIEFPPPDRKERSPLEATCQTAEKACAGPPPDLA